MTGPRALHGKPSLAQLRPDLVAEWSPLNPFGPETKTVSSNVKVAWVCAAGHTWLATIYHRSHGTGCPFCSGKRAIPGETDVATVRPDLVAEWSPLNPFGPETKTVSSGAKVTWVCAAAGHTWTATINARSAGRGCPFCSGKRAIPGETDVATVRPDLAAEWSPLNPFGPETKTVSSNVKVTWVCAAAGHTWTATINNRSKGRGCPECAKVSVSEIERQLFLAVAHVADTAVHGQKLPVAWGRRRHADIDVWATFRARDVVVEYDGEYWHRGKAEVDECKTRALLLAGYAVVRVRADGLPHLAIEHPLLLQLDYQQRWGSGAPVRTAESLRPIVDEIAGWAAGLGVPSAA